MPPGRKRYGSFTLNPIHPHCGPGNDIREFATDRIDAICRKHDIDYNNIGYPHAYIKFNKADEEFIDAMSKEKGLPAELYTKVFKLKKKIAPTINRGRGAVSTPSAKRKLNQVQLPTPPPSSKRQKQDFKEVEMARKKSAPRSTARAGRSIKSKGRLGPKMRKMRKTTGKKFNAKRYNKKQNMWSKVTQKGISFLRESTGSTVSPFSVYVGHSTTPVTGILLNIAYAIVKSIFTKAGYQMTDVDDTVTGTGQVILDWQPLPNSSISSDTQAFTAGTTSYATIAGGLNTALGNKMISTSAPNVASILKKVRVEIAIDAGSKYYEIDMTNASIWITVESKLILQNRSYTADGLGDDDNAINVDNIPLVGKSYYGKTMGTYYTGKNESLTPFYARNDLGFIEVVTPYGSGTGKPVPSEPALASPPDKGFFKKISVIKPIGISPGAMTTDKMFYKTKMNLNQYLRKLYLFTSVGSYGYLPQMGHFKFFGLEKKIHQLSISANEDVNPVRVAWQCNQKIGTYLTYFERVQTKPLYSRDDTF